MNFCVDCKWHEAEEERILFSKLPIHYCTGVTNEVTGRPMRILCSKARLGGCRGGALFTPKDTTDA